MSPAVMNQAPIPARSARVLHHGACRAGPAIARRTSRPFSRCRSRWARSAACGSCVTMMIVLFSARAARQQVEDFVGGLRVEVAGRLVGDDQRRVGDDRPGDADALLLAAGELPRPVRRCGPTGRPGRAPSAPACLPLGGRQRQQQQRQFDVLVGRQHRQQVVELEHEADVPRPPAGQLALGHRG